MPKPRKYSDFPADSAEYKRAYQREYAHRQREQRRAAGLCTKCGQPLTDDAASRKGTGTPFRLCPSCRKKAGEQNRSHSPEKRATLTALARERREQRRRDGYCITCGRELPEPREYKPDGVPHANCPTCRQKERARSNYRNGLRRGIERERTALPYPLISCRPAVPMHYPRQFGITLDHTSYRSIERLYEKYREAERAAGRRPLFRQASRLIREAIRHSAGKFTWYDLPRYQKNPALPDRFNLRLDAETWEIVEQEAFRLHVRYSEAIRGLLYYAAFPPDEARPGLYPREIIRFNGDGTADVLLEDEDFNQTYLRPYVIPSHEDIQRRLAEQEAAANDEYSAP